MRGIGRTMAAVFALAGANGAVAQTAPVQLSTNGERPFIAVDEEGAAHVVWNERVTGGADILHYCRVPRGAAACDVSKTLVPPEPEPQYNTDTAGPKVVLTGPESVSLLTFRYPNVITVDKQGSPVADCYSTFPSPSDQCYGGSSKTWIFNSTDNGRTFGPAHVFSHKAPSGDAGVLQVPFGLPASGAPGEFGNGPLIQTVTDTESGGTFFDSAPPEGYARTWANLGDEGPDRAYSGTVAALNDATPVAAFADLASNVYVRAGNGNEPRNDIATWKPAVRVDAGQEPHLAGGPGGVHLLYRPNENGGSGTRLVVRPFDGNAVGAATQVSDGGTIGPNDITEDDSGRLHVAWARRDSTRDALRYRFSPDGTSFSAGATLATGPSGSMSNVHLGAAEDGGGWAVWSSKLSGNGTISLTHFGTQAARTLIDARPTAIEVTQGVQDETLPPAPAQTSSNAGLIQYAGAPLAEGLTTYVRVYVDLRKPLPPGAAIPTMTLRHTTDGGKVSGAILPETLPASLAVGGPSEVTTAQRFTPNLAYSFWIPWQWARGDVTLIAELNPADLQPSLAECRRCRDDNTLRLAHIRFQPTTRIRVYPVEVDVNGARPSGAPNLAPYFQKQVQAFTPLPIDLVANPPQIDIGPQLAGPGKQSDKEALAAQRVRDVASANGKGGKDIYPYGIFPTGQGAGNGLTVDKPLFTSNVYSIGDDSRPITSIGHEFHHGLGRVHADLVCGGNNKDTGQVGEAWPPNDDGAMDGVGLDTRGPAPYSIISNKNPATAGTTLYDLMSYCPAGGVFENRDWISLKNWKRAIDFNKPAARAAAGRGAHPAPPALRPVARAAAARTLRYLAAVTAGDAPAGSYVTPDAGAPTPVDPASPYRLVARSADGRDLATAGAVVSEVRTHSGAVVLVSGRVPAAGAASVALLQNGAQAAEVRQSAHAPAVRILSPRRRATVGGGATTDVRWRASDADGDTLQALVEYSADGGGSWQTISSGPNGGRVRLSSRLLTASRRARLRVRVQDGFREAVAEVGPFVSRGAPPAVRLLAPVPGSRVVAGTRLALDGGAVDDAGAAIAGRRLRWFDGRRRIAGGGRAFSPGLAPGRHRIALEATDRTGRRARATVTVVVGAAAPQFSVLKAPGRLSSKARRVTLRVATTFPARLRAGGRSFAVGPRVRTVRVRVRPGRSLLQLPLTLVAGGKRARVVQVVPRR